MSDAGAGPRFRFKLPSLTSSLSSDPGDLRRRRTRILIGLGTVVLLASFFGGARRGFFDLFVYHGAVNYWVHDGGVLYDFVAPASTYGFTYPPFAALLMLPFAIMPWHLTIVVNCVACVAATAVLIYWLVDPVARREGWTRWYALGLVGCAAVAFEPLRDTFLFGQVNVYLVLLVAADLLLLIGGRARGGRWRKYGGVGIGLATAIKLTPGAFIVYLAVTRRWRAAAVASATAAVATLFAAAVAPRPSTVFWTDALWNTDRVGVVAYVSNQSLMGAVARLNPADPSALVWGVAVLSVLVLWAIRVRQAIRVGDELTGMALTGILSCLISPVTWVHHLVWVGPAILLLLDNVALARARPRRRRLLAGFLVASAVLLSSRLVWIFSGSWDNPFIWVMSNTYVWVSLALLIGLPVRQLVPAAVSRAERPALAESAVAEPVVTEPAVSEPAVTEPAVTEPAVTEPAVTEPPMIGKRLAPEG